jgi:meckelin
MSRFAVDFSFYVLIALAQWLVQVFLVEKIADPFRNFMDLCSMANISVLAMPYPLRGYYIHGRSVHGMADTDMHEMNRFLKRERENLCSLRGLESGSEIQTFIVNMPFSFRERLNQILGGMMGSLRGNTTTKVEVTAMVHSESNEFLRDVVNHGDQNCDYTVQDSRLVEQILGINLADTSKTGSFTRFDI